MPNIVTTFDGALCSAGVSNFFHLRRSRMGPRIWERLAGWVSRGRFPAESLGGDRGGGNADAFERGAQLFRAGDDQVPTGAEGIGRGLPWVTWSSAAASVRAVVSGEFGDVVLALLKLEDFPFPADEIPCRPSSTPAQVSGEVEIGEARLHPVPDVAFLNRSDVTARGSRRMWRTGP